LSLETWLLGTDVARRISRSFSGPFLRFVSGMSSAYLGGTPRHRKPVAPSFAPKESILTSHDIAKALEVWSLQTTAGISVILGLLALGLALIRRYVQQTAQQLTLRVSVEIWDVVSVVLTDLMLSLAVLLGFIVLNPDIMADIKIAVPFLPLATVLLAAALVIRLFHGGHVPGTRASLAALWFMGGAALLNIVGYTLVMEAPSGEYLALHPSPFWSWIKTHLRSNASPHGLELAQVTFIVCFALLMLVLVWGFVVGMRHQREERP